MIGITQKYATHEKSVMEGIKNSEFFTEISHKMAKSLTPSFRCNVAIIWSLSFILFFISRKQLQSYFSTMNASAMVSAFIC